MSEVSETGNRQELSSCFFSLPGGAPNQLFCLAGLFFASMRAAAYCSLLELAVVRVRRCPFCPTRTAAVS